jgi:signal transduction histidine kinase
LAGKLSEDAGGRRSSAFSNWRRKLRSFLPPLTSSLPAKLLLLTILFVMLAEVLIFVPSVANRRRNWLMERLTAAQIASLSLEASDSGTLPPRLQAELLNTAGVYAVSLKRDNFRQLVLQMPSDAPISAVYDMRHPGWGTLIADGLDVFFTEPGRFVRVLGKPEMSAGNEIDVVIDETPLHAAVWAYAANIFWLSLIISVFTAAFVYLALNALLVRPMMRITRNFVHYRENPVDSSRIILPSGRDDEVGVAERELAAMQSQLSTFLKEKARLAALGLAVSKINHDLRNMLAGAQLVSDRLATVPDPTVQTFAPRLIRALDRAITLCVDILAYGRSEERPPKCAKFRLRPLVEEVAESLGLNDRTDIRLSVEINDELQVWADEDQLFRVLSNLMRNAMEALNVENGAPLQPTISLNAKREGGFLLIQVADNGPGVPPLARPNLFHPFHLSSKGGSGLGLAISAELTAAHGGRIVLEETAGGASFLISLPYPEK